MQELRWLDHLPGETLEGGIERANELLWNITIEQYEGRWWVGAGDQTLFVTDSHETLDAFLYGLGLAYGVLPDHIFEQLKQAVTEWAELQRTHVRSRVQISKKGASSPLQGRTCLS